MKGTSILKLVLYYVSSLLRGSSDWTRWFEFKVIIQNSLISTYNRRPDRVANLKGANSTCNSAASCSAHCRLYRIGAD